MSGKEPEISISRVFKRSDNFSPKKKLSISKLKRDLSTEEMDKDLSSDDMEFNTVEKKPKGSNSFQLNIQGMPLNQSSTGLKPSKPAKSKNVVTSGRIAEKDENDFKYNEDEVLIESDEEEEDSPQERPETNQKGDITEREASLHQNQGRTAFLHKGLSRQLTKDKTEAGTEGDLHTQSGTILTARRRGAAGEEQSKEFVIRKNSNFSKIWNMVILICILLDLIVIPLEVSLQDVEYINAWSFAILSIIQVCYVADIYVSFNQTYYDGQVREVKDKKLIMLRYFESSEFAVDLFSCAPIFAFRKIFFYSKGYNQLFLLIRIVKSFKIKRILVSYHQWYYISGRLYFLAYLISVLVIVRSILTLVAFGDVYLVQLDHHQVLEVSKSSYLRRRFLLNCRTGFHNVVAASNLPKHRT